MRSGKKIAGVPGGKLRFGAFTRGRYSTDVSHDQIVPLGWFAHTIAEADHAIGICR